ncbi:ribonuclease H-like domain-containing protein [Tanacetum coccineum]
MTEQVLTLTGYEEINGGCCLWMNRKSNKYRVKIIRCDNGTEFKNKEMNQFCDMKWIKREFSVVRTPQQNGVAERKNRTLKSCRTMLSDSKFPNYLFGLKCPVTILNTLDHLGTKESIDAGQARKKTVPSHEYILLPLWTPDSPISLSHKSSDDGVADDAGKKSTKDPANEGDKDDQDLRDEFEREFERLIVQGKEAEININSTNSVFAVSSSVNTAGTKDADDEPMMPNLEDTGIYLMDVKSTFLYGKIEEEVYVCQPPGFEDPEIASEAKIRWDFFSQDKYVDEILKKVGFSTMRIASTPVETLKLLLKDVEAEDIDVHFYRSMIGSLMYLTAFRPDIIISRYLKGQPKLGLKYPKDSPFDFEAYTDCDYAGASLDRKSTIRGCQFLGSRLISWQCKKQTVVANSTTEADAVEVTIVGYEVIAVGYVFTAGKDLILNGDSPLPTRTVNGVETAVPLITFNTYKSDKSLMEAIEKRFGGNKESKKVQKTLLKKYTNEAVKTAHGVFADNSKDNTSTLPNVDNLRDVEIELKWQMAMLTMRAWRFLKKTGKNLGVNGTDTIGFDKTKVECYNCHIRGHFARECKTPRNQDSRNRRTVPVEETTTNALVSQCDGLGYDWSDQAKEGHTNFALMAYTSSSSSRAYKEVLESVEARLDVYKKNEVVFEKDIKILKLDIMLRDNALTELRKKFKKAKKKDDLKLTLEKFENSSKNLSKLLHSQVIEKFKTGLGYDSQVFDSQVNDKYKIGEGYHAVPPPYTRNFMPPKPDLVLANEDEYVFSELVTSVPIFTTSEVKTSKSKPKSVSEPLIEDWISDSENENETESKSRQRKPNYAKVEFVKYNEHVKSPRESVEKIENYKQAKYPKKNSQSPRGNKRNWNNMMTQKLGSNFEFKNKACYVCGSFNHLIKDCNFYEKKMVEKSVWNNAIRVNHQNSQRMSHLHPKGNFVPKTVLMKSGLKTLNTARQASNVFIRAHSHVRRPFNKFATVKNSNFNEKVNNVKGNVTTIGTKEVVIEIKGYEANCVKASAGNPQQDLKDKGVIDSGCSRHMTGNRSYLIDYEEID